LTISARTGGRNDRVGNVLVQPIQYDVEDRQIVRAHHVDVGRTVELAAERRVIKVDDGRRRDGMGRAGVDGVTGCIIRRPNSGWCETWCRAAIVSVYDLAWQ